MSFHPPKSGLVLLPRTAALAVAVALLLVALVGKPAYAAPRIVNGVASHDDPAVGVLLMSFASDSSSARMTCSGTLIGCRTFVTAAHCVATVTDPDAYFVHFQHAGFFAVRAIHVVADFEFPIGDLAVLELAQEVTGIEPARINDVADPLAAGPLPGRIVGYGETQGNGNNFGIKRSGGVVTAPCRIGDNQGPAPELLCWDFVEPIGEAGSDSNTCSGDSGGPLFMDLGDGEVLAGVSSGGENRACLPADHSWDVNLYFYRAFIDLHLGDDGRQACGLIPAVGTSEVEVHANDGVLTWKDQNDRFTFEVPAGINELRVTLNAKDDGTFDPDLYLRHGSPPSLARFDCAAKGPSPYGSCRLFFPKPGTWHLLVNRASGAGDYQTTVTVFGGDPPDCGNGVRELGEICDGIDDSACPGLCLPGCDCPPPVCGNGSQESGEQCDDGNHVGNDGCDPSCLIEECGNGVLQAFEQCDDGNAVNADDCLNDCTLPRCGDGFIRPGEEECDDGNFDGGDGCDGVCRVEPVAVGGGGRFEGGFAVAGRNVFSFSIDTVVAFRAETGDGEGGCPADIDTVMSLLDVGAGGVEVAFDDDEGVGRCALLDLVLDPGDYEIVVSGWDGQAVDYYVLDLRITPFECGNGVVEAGEQCDDGNRLNGDCCDAGCSMEPQGSACGADNEVCTDDICDGTGFCIHVPNSAPCDDGDPCTVADHCSAGLCAGGEARERICRVAGVCFACGQPLSRGNAPSAGDALLVLRASVGLEDCALCVCDVNASDTLTTSDALAVLLTAVGAGGEAFACPSPSSTSTTLGAPLTTTTTSTTTSTPAATSTSTTTSVSTAAWSSRTSLR